MVLKLTDISRISVVVHVSDHFVDGKLGGADGWAKNQLGERRLGELFFGRHTILRQQSFQ